MLLSCLQNKMGTKLKHFVCFLGQAVEHCWKSARCSSSSVTTPTQTNLLAFCVCFHARRVNVLALFFLLVLLFSAFSFFFAFGAHLAVTRPQKIVELYGMTGRGYKQHEISYFGLWLLFLQAERIFQNPSKTAVCALLLLLFCMFCVSCKTNNSAGGSAK